MIYFIYIEHRELRIHGVAIFADQQVNQELIAVLPTSIDAVRLCFFFLSLFDYAFIDLFITITIKKTKTKKNSIIALQTKLLY